MHACIILLRYFTTRGFKPFGFDATFTQESLTDGFIGHDKALVLVLHGNESFQVDVLTRTRGWPLASIQTAIWVQK